ncbi:DUF3597 domain-containing protein [Pollutimonas bauzanensis]|uniref:DUF3597 domain-containing protein n=1 Tax=Pollutimonas bauzanensis TaxID=658167 RepID=A0A1M5MWT4_9BURK|nr:DUF3597 domain-containing protein [Pollutimonas bauzanensis]SHG81223.1 protein of unknown function [Pollutimonas bauzanensis]
MSIFKSILAKIFPSAHPADSPPAPTAAPAPGTGSSAAAPAPAGGAAGTSAPGTPQTPASQPVDVEAVLTEMQSKHPEKLNWKTSIVDLLKLLGLDSSLAARKQLAAELHYTGSTDDSAAMNTWLHKEVMRKFGENGGKVPADLKD